MTKIVYKTYCPNCRLGYKAWDIPGTSGKKEIRIGGLWDLPAVAKLTRACTACGFISEAIPITIIDGNPHSSYFGQQIFAKIKQVGLD